jgi:hypothetical protein
LGNEIVVYVYEDYVILNMGGGIDYWLPRPEGIPFEAEDLGPEENARRYGG